MHYPSGMQVFSARGDVLPPLGIGLYYQRYGGHADSQPRCIAGRVRVHQLGGKLCRGGAVPGGVQTGATMTGPATATALQQRGGTPHRETWTASGGTTTTAAPPPMGTPSGDAERGAYRDFARNLYELMKCDQEGSRVSVLSSAKDPRETNLGSKGDLS